MLPDEGEASIGYDTQKIDSSLCVQVKSLLVCFQGLTYIGRDIDEGSLVVDA